MGGLRYRTVFLRVLGVVLVVVGLVTVCAVVMVRRTLLDDALYRDALVRVDAYERVYTQVLADPELASLNDRLIGRLTPLSSDGALQLRTVSTSALRWAVPPSSVRDGTEAVIAQTMAYVRGDTDRLDGAVTVAGVLARVDKTAVTEVRTVLAAAADTVSTSLVDYQAYVEVFASALASGRVPTAVPVLGGTEFDPEAVVAVILDAVGDRIDARTRDQVIASVYSGAEREALLAAGAVLVAEHAGRVAGELRSETIADTDVDWISEVADRAGLKPGAVVDELNGVRDAARWLSWPTAAAGIVAVVCGLFALMAAASDRRRGVLWGAAALVIGALAFGAGWWAVARVVGSPLEAASGSGSSGWRLPEGVRLLLADVESTVGREIARRVRELVVVCATAGAALAAGALIGPGRRALTRTRLTLVACGAAAAAGSVWFASSAATMPVAPRLCNGSPELCERRYDDVVYAATHNSMSSPDVVDAWPEHDHNIRAQLDNGIRALLIDTHYWTALGSEAQLAATDAYLPPDVVARVFGALGSRREARPGTYLCHIHCALGATPFGDALRDIKVFLDGNPNEVVTLIVQDAITPADTAAAFEESGIDVHLHTHRPGSRWPTLGELIERDERLIVFAESQGPPPGWYHSAFAAMQETPFLFRTPEAFSCASNRGDRDATLFLMNHWVQRSAPDRVDAANVNRHDVIVERARKCRNERGLRPNYIAVNFANIGDVVAAVATLNRDR